MKTEVISLYCLHLSKWGLQVEGCDRMIYQMGSQERYVNILTTELVTLSFWVVIVSEDSIL